MESLEKLFLKHNVFLICTNLQENTFFRLVSDKHC